MKRTLFLIASLLWTTTTAAQIQETKLIASDGAASDWFGQSVSLDGDYALVGAYRDSDHGNASGSAYVFQRVGATWSQVAKLTASDAARADFFGQSVSLDGDYALVGADYDDAPGTDSGSAYVFQRVGATWSQVAKLTASDGVEDGNFGNSVSLDGDYALVGAYRDSDDGNASGSAYVFQRVGATWSQVAKLTASDVTENDHFGNSVSLDDDYALVGAFLHDDDGSASGSACVFQRVGATWSQVAKLTASDGAENDNFGNSVSLDGDYALVGAYHDDAPGTNSGSAYVFQRVGATWSQVAKLTASDGVGFDFFGTSVSLDGDYALAGAYAPGSNFPSAYVFSGITGLGPQISINPTSIDFGTVVTSSLKDTAVTIQNIGSVDLDITNLTLTAGDVGFSLAQPFAPISPGSDSTITVRFTPIQEGVATDTLVIQHNAPGGSTAVILNGIGQLPFQLQLVDALDLVEYPTIANDSDPQITTDSLRLTTEGTQAAGVVTDGISKLLLRLQITESNLEATTATFSLNGTGNPQEDGILHSVDGLQSGTTLTVEPVPTSQGEFAFAVYEAPTRFVRDGFSNDEQSIERSIGLAVDVASTPNPVLSDTTEITLVRPPVILVHGLWSKGDTWDTFRNGLEDAIPGISAHIFVVDYQRTHASSFIINRERIKEQIFAARQQFRSQGIAAVQADVIGHSMGGLLGRIWAGTGLGTYRRSGDFNHTRGNYGFGDIYRLITIDTPHFGSFWADLITPFQQNIHPELRVHLLLALQTSRHSVHNGAVTDLMTSSEALRLMLMSEVDVPTHAILGNAAVADLTLVPGSIGRLGVVLQYFGFDTQITVPGDIIVSETSQAGGLAPVATSTFIHTHNEALQNPDVINRIVELLNAPPDDPGFQTFPVSEVGTKLLVNQQADDATLALISPAGPEGVTIIAPGGTTVEPGDVVDFNIEVSSGISPNSVLFVSPDHVQEAGSAPFIFQVTIPDDAAGPMTILALGKDEAGTLYSDEIALNVEPVSSVQSIQVNPAVFHFLALGSHAQIQVNGLYSDGVTRDVSVGETGTTYLTNNQAVVDVDANGVLTALSDGSATITVSHAGLSASIDVTVQSIEGFAVESNLNMLDATEIFVRPGGTAVIPIELRVFQEVAGVQFTIQPRIDGVPTDDAQFTGVINDLESQGFTVSSATDTEGRTTVLLFGTTGETISPGSHSIIELVYTISSETPHGTWIELIIEDDFLSDANSQAIPHTAEGGSIQTGEPGDLVGGILGAGDGKINVLDIIKEVRYILGRIPMPDPLSSDPVIRFAYYLADPNEDGKINVLDIIWMVNHILQDEQTKVLVDGPKSPVKVSLGDLYPRSDGQLAIPITTQADGSIAGLQATLSFDASKMRLGTPYLAGRAAEMTIETHIQNGTLHLLVYSLTGRSIADGHGSIIIVPVTMSDETSAAELGINNIVIADRQGQSVSVGVEQNIMRVTAVPTEFLLKHARPNPFNPSTLIAYEVPEQSHIALIVYNILGQEVVRLVDMVQAPGRYVVTWNGRNAQDRRAASGIYLYRMTSITGFSESKRMTLLK